MQQKRNYVDNKRFQQLILEFHERRQTNPAERIPNEIGKMLIAISENLAGRYNFASYTYRDEFVGDGVLRAVEAFKSFDPNKSSNPFAYFTKVIFRTFVQRIKKEKRERQLRNELIMVNEIFVMQEGDNNKITLDTIIGDYQFDSSSYDNNQ